VKNHLSEDERAELMRRGQEQTRREWDQGMATLRRAVSGIGLPLICPEPACGRARRCAAPSRSLPPCWELYREEARYIMFTLRRLWEHIEATGERPDPAAPKPERPLTLLEAVFGPDLSRLRRRKGAPEATHGAESDPEAFDRYFMAGDWREPFRPPPRTTLEWFSVNARHRGHARRPDPAPEGREDAPALNPAGTRRWRASRTGARARR
jgi:hypothetical protein